jgi:NAD-dependent DNA ligase
MSSLAYRVKNALEVYTDDPAVVTAYYCSKAGIPHLRGARAKALQKAGALAQPADLYNLRPEDFVNYGKATPETADKIHAAILASQTQAMPDFLAALCIPGLDRAGAERLDAHYHDMGNLLMRSPQQLMDEANLDRPTAWCVAIGLELRQQWVLQLLHEVIIT